ncbi:MAG: hypothetical protein KL863_26105 [Rhizobium sp.]|nr:hypothetical protein [Rhizobium sp.]
MRVFRGLHADDDLIRDFDRPAYFARILDRIDDLPVIELCPGDDPSGEMALMLSRNAIVLPVMPEHDTDIMRQLYWTLTIGGGVARGAAATPVQSFRAMQSAIETIVPADYRLRTDAYLKTANMTAETSPEDWQTALRFRHGDAVRPLTGALPAMEQAINTISADEMVADLPDDWRRSVSTLSDLHARWRLLKLNFPVALPELFTSGLELQSNARHIGNSELTEASRGVGQ